MDHDSSFMNNLVFFQYPRNTWRREVKAEMTESCHNWCDRGKCVPNRVRWRAFINGLCSILEPSASVKFVFQTPYSMSQNDQQMSLKYCFITAFPESNLLNGSLWHQQHHIFISWPMTEGCGLPLIQDVACISSLYSIVWYQDTHPGLSTLADFVA